MNDTFCIPTTFLEAMNGQLAEQKLAAAEIKIAALEAQLAAVQAANASLTALLEHVTTAALSAKG